MTEITDDILALDYFDFSEWADQNREDLSDFDQKWLGSWEMVDLAISPIDDGERIEARKRHRGTFTAKPREWQWLDPESGDLA